MFRHGLIVSNNQKKEKKAAIKANRDLLGLRKLNPTSYKEEIRCIF